jgi:hypothetical protein
MKRVNMNVIYCVVIIIIIILIIKCLISNKTKEGFIDCGSRCDTHSKCQGSGDCRRLCSSRCKANETNILAFQELERVRIAQEKAAYEDVESGRNLQALNELDDERKAEAAVAAAKIARAESTAAAEIEWAKSAADAAANLAKSTRGGNGCGTNYGDVKVGERVVTCDRVVPGWTGASMSCTWDNFDEKGGVVKNYKYDGIGSYNVVNYNRSGRGGNKVPEAALQCENAGGVSNYSSKENGLAVRVSRSESGTNSGTSGSTDASGDQWTARFSHYCTPSASGDEDNNLGRWTNWPQPNADGRLYGTPAVKKICEDNPDCVGFTSRQPTVSGNTSGSIQYMLKKTITGVVSKDGYGCYKKGLPTAEELPVKAGWVTVSCTSNNKPEGWGSFAKGSAGNWTMSTKTKETQRNNECNTQLADESESQGGESADTESADTESADTESADTESANQGGGLEGDFDKSVKNAVKELLSDTQLKINLTDGSYKCVDNKGKGINCPWKPKGCAAARYANGNTAPGYCVGKHSNSDKEKKLKWWKDCCTMDTGKCVKTKKDGKCSTNKVWPF